MAGKLACCHILVAEDDRLLADLLMTLIKLHDGIGVGPASSEEETQEILSRESIDATILDVVLASGPCFSLVEELMVRGVPVILTTGHALSQIPDEFSDLPLFSKPFHVGTLVDRLVEQCRMNSLA